MNTTLDSLTPNDILPQFYEAHNLGEDGGNKIEYVTIVFSKYLQVYIPNIQDRKKAVLKHDIHHILTGYESEIIGEFEIAGWEIASGCMIYWVAYALNSLGLIMGLFLAPRRMIAGFVRGSYSSNLYLQKIDESVMKTMTISDLKKAIKLDEYKDQKMTTRIFLTLILHLFISVGINLLVLMAMPFMILYNIYILIKYKF
jgi:hypothetical protein